MQELDERVPPIINGIAQSISRRFKGYVEYEDLQQECLLWCLSHQPKLGEFMAKGKDGQEKLAVSLKRRCEQFARRNKAASVGFKISDEAFFEIASITDLLPYMFDKDHWHEGPPPHLEQSKICRTKLASEGGNWVASLIDVSYAFDHLTKVERVALRRIYRDEWSFEQLAHANQCSYDQARSEIGRALERMLELLGGESPWN